MKRRRCITCQPERHCRAPRLMHGMNSLGSVLLLYMNAKVPPLAMSVQSSPHSYRLTLPDSNQSPPIQLIGSPAFSQSVDSAGYTLLVDPKDGYVKYAAVDGKGEVVPTKFKMLKEEGNLDPGEVYGLEPHVEPSVQAKRENCGQYCVEERDKYEWRETGENGGCEIFCLDGGIFRRLTGSVKRWMPLGRDKRVHHDDKGRHEKQQYNRTNESIHKRSDDEIKPSMPPKSITTTKQDPGARNLLPIHTNNKLTNLVIPIKFANHASRPSISTSDLTLLFNSPNPIEELAPTGSIQQYFAYNSYGQLIVESFVTDWIRVRNTEQYYAGKKSGISETFHECLVQALNTLDSDPTFDFTEYDKDGDGRIDSLFFLHSGYSAEWGGVDCINGNDRSNRIWSHKWKIADGWVSKSGVRVDDYAVSSAIHGVCGKSIARIGTIAHEMGRLFGLPSLYGGDAPHGGYGIGSFGLMGNSWGWDGTQYYPPVMSPWSKMEMGWLQPVTITSSGIFSLPPVGDDPKVYRIDLGRDDEFLLLENRAATSFDSMMPRSGLVIWHIDNRALHYPDDGLIDPTSLANYAHYRVSVVAADGKFDLERGVNRGDEGDIFGSNHTLGIGFTGEHTTFPNTDSYRDGIVKPSGIEISSISNTEDDPDGNIKFTVIFPGDTIPDTAPPSPRPTPTPNFKTVERSLLSTFGANTGSTGIMFDIVAINSITITSMDLHLRSTAADGEKLIEVHTLSGTHIGNESSPQLWQKVCCSKRIIGNGVAKRTKLDPSIFFREILVAPGERMAFYVASDEPIVRYSSSSNICCEIFVSSLDLQIYEGSGVGSYPFGSFAKSRVFNGAIHYETMVNIDQNASTFQASSMSYSPERVKSVTSKFFSGNSGGFGIAFDIIPKKNMMITSLDFHTDLEKAVDVNVWTRRGSHVGHERDQLDWERVCSNAKVIGLGPYKPTPIDPSLFQPVKLSSFERASFYITLSTPNMRYSKVNQGITNVGDIVSDLPDIRVLAGSGIGGFPFGAPISPRLWNGSIHYVLLGDPDNETIPSGITKSRAFSTNNVTLETNRLSTTFASGNRGYGSMFDVSNTEGSFAVITSIDFHTDLLNEIHVIVYTKEGSFSGSEFKPHDWTIIANTNVTGQGYYKRTTIPPSEFQKVAISNGSTRGFYVSIDQPNLLYSNVDEGKTSGEIWSQSNGIRIHIGSGLQANFSNVFQPRIHNGAIHYYHESYGSSLAPQSLAPTNSPRGDKYRYETQLNGQSGSFGVMFSIRNKTPKTIYVTSVAFHSDLIGECAVEIYTISGSYKGRENKPNEWEKLSSTIVKANGLESWSEVPAFRMQPVQIYHDTPQSFYITLEYPNLKYSLNNVTDTEGTPLGDKYIEIYDGSGVGGYPFGMNISPRQPELRIDYEVVSLS